MSDDLQALAFDAIKRETPKAILVKFDEQDVWLPLSQIEIERDEHGIIRSILATPFIIREKELEAFT